MRILFSTGHFGFLRNFESTLRLIAERGHRVHLVADRRDQTDGERMVENLVRAHPDTFVAEVLPYSKQRLWYPLATGLRGTLDYWRYVRPEFDGARSLRQRAERQAPRATVAWTRVPVLRSRPVLTSLGAVARAVERALPTRPEVEQLFDRVAPDVLVLTPLLYFGSQQPDYVRAARRRGVPSVLCVGSWDHLTTKGLIHEIPDRVVVWNEAQREEAWRFHGVPPDRVVVTGAQPYDHWFSFRPSTSRDGFCARIGLPADRPYFLYLCSSPFIAPEEVPFVRRWIAAIRASGDQVVRTAGILVRPHPQNAAQWRDVELDREFEDVAVWPRAGANPVDAAARADYFDAMHYSVAVVGVNTSALIESGIVGRPVYSIVDRDFAATQEGTLHFQHLKSVNGGLLHLASGLDEHAAQLSHLMKDVAAAGRGPRAFVEAFVRPHGLEAAATPRVVDAIEQAAALAVRPQPASGARPLLHAVLTPVAAVTLLAALDPDKRRRLVQEWRRGAASKVR